MIRVVAAEPARRGDLFTDRMQDLINAWGFVPVRVNIHKSGREIDIQARHRYEARQAIIECKAQAARIGGDEINKFIGVLDAERRSTMLDTVGYFISLSGFKDSALEQESVLNQQRCVLLDGEAICAALVAANVIVDEGTARVRAAESCEVQGWTADHTAELLATAYGWVWRVCYSDAGETVGYALINAKGQRLHKSASDDLAGLLDAERPAAPRDSATRPAGSAFWPGAAFMSGRADRRAADPRWKPRTILTAAGVSAGVLAVVGLFWLTGMPQTPAPATPSTATPGSQPTAQCDRYVVTAREVALRDEAGEPADEEVFVNGQQVTVLDRRSESGPPSIWLVTTDDGVEGWVDHSYLRSACGQN